MLDTTTLKAGEELDAGIAVHIMGAQLINYVWYDGTRKPFLWWPDDDPPRGDDFQRLPNGWLCEWNSIPPYSSGIAAAWQVITRLNAQGWWCELLQTIMDGHSLDWHCILHRWPEGGVQQRVSGWGQTLPEAICQAAFAAVDAV